MAVKDLVQSCDDTYCGVKVPRHVYARMTYAIDFDLFFMVFTRDVDFVFRLINPLELVILNEDVVIAPTVKESVLGSLCR